VRARPARVLVAYGSSHGGTREIAAAIVETMRNEGLDAELGDASDVRSLDGYDAVVLGGALYMNRWHRAARRFLVDHAEELRARPVWLFSSGPLDDSASKTALPPTAQIENLMARIGARDHAMFGGVLRDDTPGFLASRIARDHAGDWREWHQIRAWGRDIARVIRDEDPRPLPVTRRDRSVHRWLLAALCLFTGLTAIGGGATLALRPDGSLLQAPISLLAHSPFHSFLVPGLLLLLVVGLGNMIAGVLVARRVRVAPLAALVAGLALLVWIATEIVMLRELHWLQLAYLVVAVVILAEAWKTGAARELRTRLHARELAS
jgi:menaquinone-dependent protoporphyrinogen oxidase